MRCHECGAVQTVDLPDHRNSVRYPWRDWIRQMNEADGWVLLCIADTAGQASGIRKRINAESISYRATVRGLQVYGKTR